MSKREIEREIALVVITIYGEVRTAYNLGT